MTEKRIKEINDIILKNLSTVDTPIELSEPYKSALNALKDGMGIAEGELVLNWKENTNNRPLLRAGRNVGKKDLMRRNIHYYCYAILLCFIQHCTKLGWPLEKITKNVPNIDKLPPGVEVELIADLHDENGDVFAFFCANYCISTMTYFFTFQHGHFMRRTATDMKEIYPFVDGLIKHKLSEQNLQKQHKEAEAKLFEDGRF